MDEKNEIREMQTTLEKIVEILNSCEIHHYKLYKLVGGRWRYVLFSFFRKKNRTHVFECRSGGVVESCWLFDARLKRTITFQSRGRSVLFSILRLNLFVEFFTGRCLPTSQVIDMPQMW